MTLSKEQLDAMIQMAPNPNQSATVLGHSTDAVNKMIPGSFMGTTPESPAAGFNASKLGQEATDLLPTAGAIAGGLGAAALATPTGPVGMYAAGVAGAGAGGAAGEAARQGIHNLTGEQKGFDVGQVAKTGGINAALDAVGGPIASFGGKVLSKAASPLISSVGKGIAKVGDLFGGSGGVQAAKTVGKTAENAVVDSIAQATKRVASTADTMTKGQRISEIKNTNRLEPTMTGGGEFTPADSEKRAGALLANKLSANPVKNIPVIKNEISTRGAEAEKYLETNVQHITNAEDQTMFAEKALRSENYMTPTAKNAYQEQLSVFQNVLKNFSSKEDGGYTTANYYKALKDFESNVTANLPKGKEALLDEGGNARLQAAKDVRAVVRDMIGQKNPEFQGKMYDLVSLYDALDNVAIKADQVDTFAKRHPVVTTAAKWAGVGAAGGAGLGLGNEAKKVIGL